MAPLTWRNVDEPDLSRASSILARAADGLQGGFSGLGDSFAGMHGIQSRNRSNEALALMSGIRGGGNVDEILAQVAGTVAPMYRTDELNAAMLNARGTGLGYDDTRSVINVREAGNNRSQETHNWDMGVRRQEAAIAPDVLRRAAEANGGIPNAGMDSRELLARTLQAEAGGEGYQGMLAAGAVIANRVNQGAYGGTLEGNIMAPGQFSAWNGVTGYAGGQGALDMSRMTPSEQAYAVADAIISGQYEDPTGGATHYYNPDAANPAWGISAGGNWTRIGNHVFGTAEGGLPTGGGGRTSIADIIPENNMISYRDWMEIEQDIYNDGQELREDGFSNRQNARTEREQIRQQEADAVLRQQQEQANTIVEELFNTLGPSAAFQGVNEIENRQDLDGAVKQIAISKLRERIQGSEEFFTPAGEVRMTPTAEAAMAALTTNDAVENMGNSPMRALERLGIADFESVTPETAAGALRGEGADPAEQQRGTLEIINETMEQIPEGWFQRYFIDFQDNDDVLRMVNRVAEETNLDPRVVAEQLSVAIESGGLTGGMAISEETLRESLAPLSDPAEMKRLLEEQRQQTVRQRQLEDLITQQQAAMQQADVFGRRNSPEAQETAANARDEVSRIDKAIARFMDEAYEGSEVDYRSSMEGRAKAEMDTGPESRRLLNAATSDERREAILESNLGAARTSQAVQNSIEQQVVSEVESGNTIGVAVLGWIRSGKMQELIAQRPELAREFQDDPIAAYVEHVLGNRDQ